MLPTLPRFRVRVGARVRRRLKVGVRVTGKLRVITQTLTLTQT